jgi:hypothetical protein
MDKVLMAIMEQLNLISVRGDDVERMVFVKQNVLRIQNALMAAKAEEQAKAREEKTE